MGARLEALAALRDGRVIAVLGTLLVLDLAFLVLHVPQVVDLTDLVERLPPRAEQIVFDRQWWLGQDGGYAERYGYFKTTTTAVLLVVHLVRSRQWVYGAWSLVLLAILLDDALELHERGGLALGESLGLPGTSAYESNLGEILIWATLGIPLLLVVLLTHRRAGPSARAMSTAFGALTAILFGFAVAVDAIHVRTVGTPAKILGTLEDGGELVVLSFMVAIALRRLLTDTAEAGY
jgi:hypothetical protein